MQNPVLIRVVIYWETLHIQNPGIFRSLTYSELWLFRTLAYWEPWYIRNTAIYGTLAYLEVESYPELLYIEALKHIHNTVKAFYKNEEKKF